MPGDWASRAERSIRAYARTTAEVNGPAAAGLVTREFAELVAHQAFRDTLREDHPHLIVPEREIVPLTGDPDWSPDHEDPNAARCPRCFGRFEPVSHEPPRRQLVRVGRLTRFVDPPIVIHVARIGGRLQPDGSVQLDPESHPDGCPKCRGRIDRGSRLHCPKCQASGFDRKLGRQAGIAGLPAPEPAATRSSRPAPRKQHAPLTAAQVARETRRARRALKYRQESQDRS